MGRTDFLSKVRAGVRPWYQWYYGLSFYFLIFVLLVDNLIMRRFDMKVQQKEAARSLREQGKSLGEISKGLGVSKSSVSIWCRDIKLTDKQMMELKSRRANPFNGAEANKNKAKKLRSIWRSEGYKRAVYDEFFKLICCLYWGEGDKRRNIFSIANSDSDMICLIYRWLVREVERSRITLRVQYHKENLIEESDIVKWWSDRVRNIRVLSTSCRLSRASQKKGIGKLPYGTATIYVCSTELVQKVFGGIDFIREYNSNG